MPEKKHGFTATEVKAGATVLAGAAVLALFIAVVSGWRPPQETTTFFSEFPDTAGLNVQGDVRFGGLKAGKVVAIAPSPEDPSKLRVTWSVSAAIPVNAESRASISAVSMISDMHLEVSTGAKGAALLPSGAFVPSKEGASGLFGAFDRMAEALAFALREDGVIGDLRAILGVRDAASRPEKKLVPVTDLIAHVDRMAGDGSTLLEDVGAAVRDNTENLDATFGKLGEVADSAKELAGRLNEIMAENRADLRETVAGSRSLVEKASKLADGLAEASDRLEALLGTAGELGKDASGIAAAARPFVEDTIRDLRETVRNLRRFSQIVSDHPQALIRGATPAGR